MVAAGTACTLDNDQARAVPRRAAAAIRPVNAPKAELTLDVARADSANFSKLPMLLAA